VEKPKGEMTVKLIIQIPCFNEEKTLSATVRDLPKKISGVDKIEVLVIDDGSTDRTAEVAQQLEVDHIVRFNRNKGLARAFSAGLEKCLVLGADIIVNTDADNQYCGEDICKLVQPIVEGKADMVVGDRQVSKISHFSWIKRKLNRYGSALIRRLSGADVEDAVSGFRALSRDAALGINTLTDFSYTVESLIQLGNQKFRILSVPIRTNETLRKSRLFKSIPNFLSLQLVTMLRVYATYRALRVFSTIGILLILPGVFGFLRFLYYYFTDGGRGHVQSLIFSTVLIIIGFVVFMFGIVADLVGNNRKIIEKTLYKIKKLEFDEKNRRE
jgi:glycosyltransferase involved in cell wall biosynthesis